MSQNNRNEELEKIRLEMLNIFQKISNSSTINVGHDIFANLLKNFYQNDTKINYIIGGLQDQINQVKKAEKKEFLKLLTIASVNPLSKYISRYLTILQSCISDENSMIFTYIANIYGEIVDKIMNTFIDGDPSDKDNNNLYELFQGFCIYNMKQDGKANQICGSLCLTSLIETSQNVLQPQYLKYLWENIVLFIDLPNYQAKSELLNSLISLIFASENLFKPFSTVTLYKILDYLTDNDWFKRKLALNVVYTLVIYCQDEIVSLKGHIIEFLKVLKSDKVKEVREVCLQTLKLFNDVKFVEDEKNENNNSYQNNDDSANYDNNGNLRSQGDKKSKKELIPLRNNKVNKDGKSPKNNPGKSYQNNISIREKDENLNKSTEKSFRYEKNPINNFNHNLKSGNVIKTTKSGHTNQSNSEINLEDESILLSLNNKENKAKNIKVSRLSSYKNPKTANKDNNLNTSNLNLSQQNEGGKSARYKSTKVGSLKDLNKSKDKSFQIDNEEEKIEKIKNRKRRYTKNHRIIESMRRSEEKERERKTPKRSTHFSIFKTQLNPEFIKNAPKEEDGGILIAFKEKDNHGFNSNKSDNKNDENVKKKKEDLKEFMKSNQNNENLDILNTDFKDDNLNTKSYDYHTSSPFTNYNKNDKNKYFIENDLKKSKDLFSDKDLSFHDEKSYNFDHKNEDILGEFISKYTEKGNSSQNYNTNSSITKVSEKNQENVEENINTPTIKITVNQNLKNKQENEVKVKKPKEAAYEFMRNSSIASLKNSQIEDSNNIKTIYSKKTNEKNTNGNLNNLPMKNSKEEKDIGFNVMVKDFKTKNLEDSTNFNIAEEINTHNKINYTSKNNTSFMKNINNNNINENLVNSTNNNYMILNTTEKNFLSHEEMTFNANNNANNTSNNIGNSNNNYISDILSQMKFISEKQNFILEKIKIIEENTGSQFFNMNSRLQKLENIIYQMISKPNNMGNNFYTINTGENLKNFNNNFNNEFDYGDTFGKYNYNMSFGVKGNVIQNHNNHIDRKSFDNNNYRPNLENNSNPNFGLSNEKNNSPYHKNNYTHKNKSNDLAEIFQELKKNNPNEAFKIALKGDETNLIKLIEKLNFNLLKEVDENLINEAIQKLLIILNRGEKILIITNFIKTSFVTLNFHIKGYIVQNVKDSLHYISINKNNFSFNEEEMIDINLILTNINNRKF